MSSSLFLFFFVFFFFFAAKSYWFLFKSSISWHFLILAFLGAVIRLNFISCPNWWIVILLYSSSIKLFSGTSVSLWFAGSSLKHALICFFVFQWCHLPSELHFFCCMSFSLYCRALWPLACVPEEEEDPEQHLQEKHNLMSHNDVKPW